MDALTAHTLVWSANRASLNSLSCSSRCFLHIYSSISSVAVSSPSPDTSMTAPTEEKSSQIIGGSSLASLCAPALSNSSEVLKSYNINLIYKSMLSERLRVIWLLGILLTYIYPWPRPADLMALGAKSPVAMHGIYPLYKHNLD